MRAVLTGVLCSLIISGFSQTTYTWDEPGGGDWIVSSNWTPTRSVPLANDILVFNNGGTLTITNVPTQIIGRLIVSGNTDVTLATTGIGQRILRISNAGTALDVQSGSSLTLTGNAGTGVRSLTLAFLGVGNVVSIAGALNVNTEGPNDGGIYNATNSVTTVTGTVTHNGGSFNSSALNLSFASGGNYIHAVDGSSVPTADWDPNSNITITGMNAVYPGSMLQTFGNVTFSSALTANVTMSGDLTCAGNLTYSNVNTGNFLRLSRTGVDRSIFVGGDFTQTSGNFVVVDGNGSGTMNVAGDFNMTGGSFILKDDNGAAELNVAGDFNKSGGAFIQRTSGGSTAVVNVSGNFNHSSGIYSLSNQDEAEGDLSLAGHFSLTGGTLTENGEGDSAGNIFFNGPGTPQVYTPGGTLSQNINFTVNSGAVLELGAIDLIGSAGDFTLDGTLQMDINGTIPLNYGQVSVGGSVMVNGTIQPTFSFTPAINDNFSLFTFAGAHSGAPTVSIIPNLFSASYALGVLTITGLLPIELFDFQGKALDQEIVLTWTTLSEINNDYMAVERSGDGKTFTEIGRIAGARTTYEKHTYSLTDKKPLNGMNYYRLRQVDFDGVARLHQVIGIRFGEENQGMVLSPNPATDRLTVEWSFSGSQSVVLRIFDLNGRQLAAYTVPAGSAIPELPLYDLPAGTYILRASQGQEVGVMKFVKR